MTTPHDEARPDPLARRAEVAAGLAAVRHRIDGACRESGRDPGEVTLVAVTKFFPASDVRLLHELGVRDVGENRHQEGIGKHDECRDLDLTWHFIGGLQSNKAAAVGAWADVVQSVDRARLLTGLSRAAEQRQRAVEVLVQVNLDPAPPRTAAGPAGGPGRAGVAPPEALDLAGAIRDADGLALRGVMGVAPLDGDAGAAFERLAEVAAQVRALDPAATWMSAGMSGDLESAIARGATHVRVGSAVLGNRPQRV